MIRNFHPDDLPAIKAIHKSMGFEYSLPDFSSPLILVNKVRVENGQVVAALFLRLTAETFLLAEGSPVVRGRAIEELQPAVLKAAWKKGLDDLVCVIPPEISSDFAPALERMGWSRDRDWPMWSRQLGRADAECDNASVERLQSGDQHGE